MRINEICLYNFGSYEGANRIVCNTEDKKKNIVLFGGKNGAGKTTLFTALEISLYGSKAYGYAVNHAFYNRKIEKLINNKTKRIRPAKAYVEIVIEINNGLEIDQYRLVRSWKLDEVNMLSEEYVVYKNSMQLSETEVNDFDAFIMQMIPPELFNLYFFDGEKIVDFFLAEGSNQRIKKAFMTLCGYDAFELMQKNFKRINTANTEDDVLKQQYKELDEKIENKTKQSEELRWNQQNIRNEIEELQAKVILLDAEYKKSGGVSEQEWSQKFTQLKEEEHLREQTKAKLKEISNDTIPFLILKTQMEQVYEQILREMECERAEKFLELLSSDSSRGIFREFFERNHMQSIEEPEQELIVDFSNYYKKYVLYDKPILQLSNDEIASFLHVWNRIKVFDVKSVERLSKIIKASLKKSQNLRKEIERCNINTVSDYVEQREKLLSELDALKAKHMECEQMLFQTDWEKQVCETEFKKVEKAYMEELKADSVRNISSAAIIMLSHLQKTLMRSKIDRVEAVFRYEVNRLIRKEPFIDDITIDKDFNIVVYRNVTYTEDELIGIINKNGTKNLVNTLGERATKILLSYKEERQSRSLAGAVRGRHQIILPIELDKNSFSSGEKQIFIMAFYKSLMELCNQEIPFVIDTPFARIDTGHRYNIVNYFFRELKGQVFILSTDEEISDEHVAMFAERIAACYTLVNTDDSRTTLVENKYFGDI